MNNLFKEAKLYGGNDEVTLKTIELSNEIPVKDWEKWLRSYGDPERMEFIGEDNIRPIYRFVYGECPLCREQMKMGTSYSYEGIIVAFTCGSYKKGAKHRFVWSRGFAFPLEGANVAMLGAMLAREKT